MAIVMAALAAWGIKHVAGLAAPSASDTTLSFVWLLTFVLLSWTTILAAFERQVETTAIAESVLDRLHVAVLVPVHNEDPALLKECLHSLLRQSRRPNSVYIVDDGTTDADYSDIIRVVRHIPGWRWARTPNRGKRHAQGKGIHSSPAADIYLTVDSDTILDQHAIREGLKPFANPAVQSVAGLTLPMNYDVNLLTRMSTIWEVGWQLIDRSGQSVLGCVAVNSGPIAFYRAPVIRRYLKAYLNEKFFSRPVQFSDDSLLTTYALMHGRTVQQPSAICFSATPEKVGHHLRRYMRWMRGSFIRNWWRMKYLPTTSYLFWLHVARWAQMAMGAIVACYLVLHMPYINPAIIPWFFVIPMLVAYMQSLRYFAVERSDQSLTDQLRVYAMAPFGAVWTLTVLRVVRWYAYATCWQTGNWGTRRKVEVGLRSQEPVGLRRMPVGMALK
jgi:hyaluronan synthase